jgi:flagellar basal-body rod protein FlgB
MSETGRIVEVLEAGLRAESLRQKAIANNVANVETDGYKEIDVRFEKFLEKALKSVKKIDLDELKEQFYETEKNAVKSNGNDVHLEVEIGKMIRNSLRYTAFVRLLSKKYEQMQRAISTE